MQGYYLKRFCGIPPPPHTHTHLNLFPHFQYLPLILTCSMSRKNIFSTIFHSNLNMCCVHTFPIELEYTTYYLSSNAFSYIASAHFLHAEYEDPCLIT